MIIITVITIIAITVIAITMTIITPDDTISLQPALLLSCTSRLTVRR